MTDHALRRLTEEQDLKGLRPDGTPSPVRQAYDKLYTSFNQGGFTLFRQGFEAAADVARAATLPEGCQWGVDAMEAFNFGKERAACTIRPG